MRCFYTFPIKKRGVISLSGPDRVDFLQGLVSNDVRRVTPTSAIWAALLTPQGRYLHDFFIFGNDETLWLDVAADRAQDLMRRLKLYKLRSKVTMEFAGELEIALAWGNQVSQTVGVHSPGEALRDDDLTIFADPRLAALGVRIIGPRNSIDAYASRVGLEQSGEESWERLRLTFGVPNNDADLIPDKSLLLENGFDELHGVAWDKGCYVGQEVTARTKYRGLVKKRLVPVLIDGPTPFPGSLVLSNDQEAGEMRSAQQDLGLALLKTASLNGVLMAGEARLTPTPPDWLELRDVDADDVNKPKQ